MSDKGSVFQKGGGGTNFEQAIQTAFLTTLIIRGNAPCINANEIIEVAFQTTNKGYETDDLLIVAKSAVGQHRLLVQIKHNITFTTDNVIFKEVIKAFWKDYNNTSIFDKAKDKLLIIKSGFTKEERNHLKSLLNWAKTHATETDFISEVNRIAGKKDRLDVFRESLKVINNNIALSDKEIWEFLKCLDILEYDFTNQNSVDEIYFLNLIKLCKNKETISTEKEIWDTISSFVSKLNKDGGSVTTGSIQKEELYKHFDIKKLNPYFKAVDKLRSDSEVVLSPLKNTICGFHLDRKNISQSIVNSVNNFQFTIVTGKPGVGKSAEIKDVLKNEFSSASIFVFRADQFNEPHIANVFSSQGVNETTQDIFSCISLIPDKIIFIDSLEKLLEADPECAFKQLLALLKEFPDIKIIGSSRKYAVDLITQKFGIDIKELGNAEVLPLSDNELNIIACKFPQLQDILKNTKIRKLLQSPKYLDFAILALNKSSDDYTNISLIEFKDKLWNSLVVDSTNIKNGLPIKRENAFMEIAVNRAKEMKLFTKPNKADAEAIVLLENDEILFQENQNRKYSPTHDILEDWALVKYVSSNYEEHRNPKELFEVLGNEPAIRRAFRLWVEDYLIDDCNKVNELIRDTILDVSIERYWADEILVAVFKSDNCSSFFSAFEKDLLENNAVLLNRCIHLVRTCCKESDLSIATFAFLIPTGSGWTDLILFIEKHLAQLNTQRGSICNFLSSWKNRIGYKDPSPSEKELLAAKIITNHFLRQVESGEEYWQQEFVINEAKELISLLYQLAPIAKSEITDLIERAFKNKEDRASWKLNSFYECVIDKCISGLGNHILIKELPELVVKTAWREWKPKKREEDPELTNISSMIRGGRLDFDECWGIQDKHSFFPSGIYKTPLHNLLWYHPIIGLKFITEFINYSVDFYVKAECDYKHKVTQIEIELNDGTKVKQWAAWELWAAYRGSSVTHYAIESVLMSLEKYLLETAEKKTERSKENLKFMFNYLLLNSNNVSIASVLTSVAIAFPEEVEDAMLPLLSVKEFFEWDLNRALQESSALAIVDSKISFAQKERWDSNQLPHRKKFLRGMSDFIVNYQLYVGKINKEIHNVFDKLKLKVKEDDVVWKKVLTEIDVRNLKLGEYDENLGGFPIQPVYAKDVVEFMNSGSDFFEAQSKSLNYSSIISKAYEEKVAINFKTWEECYSHYSKENNLDFLYDRPISLAIIGLRDFNKDLNKKQKQWCIETLNNSLVAILQDTFSRNYGLNRSYGLMEKNIALSSFHYLFSNAKNDKETNELISLMTYILFAPFNDPEIDKIIEYIRIIFFEKFPNEAKRVWCCLIRYSEFRKSNPYFYDYHDPEKLNAVKLKEKRFIDEQSKNVNISIDIPTLDLKKNEGYLLARAFVITPYSSNEKLFSNFIKHFIPLLTEDLKFEKDYSYNRSRNGRQIHFQGIHDAQFYIRDLFLYADTTLSKSVLDLILNPIYAADIKLGRIDKDLFDFSSKIPEYVIYKLDEILATSTDEVLNTQLIENFWNLWKYLFEKIKGSGKLYFTSSLFLDINWNKESSHWKVLENKKEFYHQMVKDLGTTKTQSILKLFSTAGERTFLPDGISWLVEIYKSDMNTTVSLIAPSAERMIKRLFYNHISKIKSRKKLIDDFVWILNRMVDLGSSEAYLFRENVITYKTGN